MANNDPLIELQTKLGHRFSDREKLEAALTHSSTRSEKNYERLEFLGDRVLGLVMADILFETFSDEAEGGLAKRHAALVQGQALSDIAQEIDLGSAMILSEAERTAGGHENENILADAMEAVLGALYLDAGLDACDELIKKLWKEKIHVMTEPPIDPKTALQEWAQGRGLPLPDYELVSKEGPDHAPTFEVKVTVEGYPPRLSSELSMRKAEKRAAAALLAYLEEQG
jgi:ribonuclease III